jgi:Lon protease-like protein
MPVQLPLFPLAIVLFPGALLPLHIFEPRYRRLIADIAEAEKRFGLLPPGNSGELPPPGTMGCAALLRGVRPLADGRLNIVVSGERRFSLLRSSGATTPYLQGWVEWVDDSPDIQLPTGEELARLRALGERYARAAHALNDQTIDPALPAEAAELSFEIAALLEWELEARQRFLEIRSATERVARLLHSLPGLVLAIEGRALVHARAQGNGRGGFH